MICLECDGEVIWYKNYSIKSNERIARCEKCGRTIIIEKTANAEKANNSHNSEELKCAGVEKEIKPVETPRDKELSRNGDHVPILTSPRDTQEMQGSKSIAGKPGIDVSSVPETYTKQEANK